MLNQYGCERPLHDEEYFGFDFNKAMHFGPSRTFYLFQCIFSKHSAQPTIEEREFSEQELRSWIKENVAIKQGDDIPENCVRLLMTSTPERADESEDDLLPIPLSPKLFEEVSEVFGIPSSYMEIMKLRSHVFVQTQVGYHPFYPNARGYVLQSTRSINGNFCASISFQGHRGLTYAFVHGLDPREIRGVKIRLRQLVSLTVLPTVIPIVLLEFREGTCRRALEECRTTVEKIESETGLRPQWWALRNKTIPRAPRNITLSGDSDFERITQDITTAATKLAYVRYRCNTYLPMLDSMNCVSKEVVLNAPPDRTKEWEEALIGMDSCIGRLRAVLECIQERTEYQSARADIQRQTVYSLIAQKDSSLNKKIAESSLRVAESMQRESIAMKSLAEDSKTLAVLALKENLSMRFLQIITMLFLPATFIASLFSTSLFDFRASEGIPVVSNWIWLYFGLSLMLTTATYVLWYYQSRQKDFELRKQFKAE